MRSKLRRRVAELDGALVNILRRLDALERNSHPPVAMVTCRTCSTLVDELAYDFHVGWHEDRHERMTPDQAATFMLDHSTKPLRFSLVRVQTDEDVRRLLVAEVADIVNKRGDARLVGRFVEAMHVLEPERLRERAQG